MEYQWRRRRRIIVMLVSLAAVLVGSILCASINAKYHDGVTSFLRNMSMDEESVNRRRQLSSLNLAKFEDPKSVIARARSNANAPDATMNRVVTPNSKASMQQPTTNSNQHFVPIDHSSRSSCQIIYILGVEGATHHGFIPVLENLAKHQSTPQLQYRVDASPSALKAGLFGWFRGRIIKWGFKVTPEVDDPQFVKRVVAESCPTTTPNDDDDDGKKQRRQRHVLIEWASFPSGQEDDPRPYRVHRQHEWLDLTPEQISNTEEALAHPTSMNAFYQAYSPYVDIKFVVLHRPFLETIASHRDWDGGPETHSNIIRGFMLVLRRFLDAHVYDLVTGSRLWKLVCVDRIMAKNYKTREEADAARANVIADLADFLGYPKRECPECFDVWRESTKDPEKVLGVKNVKVLREHMTWLEGVWPPPGDGGVVEQQCAV